MSQYQKVFRILGPFIGFALLYFVITNGMSFLQRGQLAAVAEEGATATITDTAGITTTEVAAATETTSTDTAGATAVTETAAAATTAAVTGAVTATVAETVTETAAATVTAAVTETAAAATQAVTETAAAATAPVTVTAAATEAATPAATEAVTATAAATAVATEAATEAAPAATEAAAPAADTSAFMKPDGSASDAVVAAINKGGCIACHTIAGVPNAMGVVGPKLDNIGAAAATREPGVTAEQYIHESLMDPNKFIAPECPFGACVPGTMPQNVAQLMTPDEVELVVQFLLTRKADS